MNNCVFCKIANNEIKKDFIYENDNFISFKDLNQDIIGHSLVVSKNHYNTILDSPDNIGVDLIDCIKNTTIKLMKENKFSGFNIIENNFPVAGQVINHLHFHIIPRQKDDNIKIIT